ncbi:DUF2471 family protein [Burkholderia alba]|uniref:DUF2471 family protein n=1 Tax=Burkholderia alba TaxID=2683677 RepID=UPI002B054A5C|nr:DUF2471 family protein [Burkholderia alba]
MSSRKSETVDIADADRNEVSSQDYRRAATALQIALVSAARERLGARVTQTVALGWPITWGELLEVERRAFARSSLQVLAAVLDSFARLENSRWLNSGLDVEADLMRDDDDLPVVVLIVRAMRESVRDMADAPS